MKVSFSTLGCPDWTLPQILSVAVREGYDGIELRFVGGDAALWRRPEFTGAGLTESVSRLSDAGLVVCCLDTSCFFHHPASAQRREALEEGERMVALAASLGAPGIRVFGDRVQAGATREATEAWIAEGLQALGERARAAGLEVWLETHGDFASGRATADILARAPGGGIGVVWDPANAFAEFGEAPAEGLRVLGDRVRHVHLKDVRPPAVQPAPASTPWEPVLMDGGCFPARDVIGLLDRAAYGGFVSFEWEKRWHPAIEEPEIALPHFAAWFRRVRAAG